MMLEDIALIVIGLLLSTLGIVLIFDPGNRGTRITEAIYFVHWLRPASIPTLRVFMSVGALIVGVGALFSGLGRI